MTPSETPPDRTAPVSVTIAALILAITGGATLLATLWRP